MSQLQPAVALVVRMCRQWGPYVLLEILLPGGTLMALLLYLHQRVRAGRALGDGGACG